VKEWRQLKGESLPSNASKFRCRGGFMDKKLDIRSKILQDDLYLSRTDLLIELIQEKNKAYSDEWMRAIQKAMDIIRNVQPA
jgi:hypothetical protein